MTKTIKNARNKRSSNKPITKQPPQHTGLITINHTFRFKSNGSASSQINLQRLLASLGTTCTVLNTTGTIDCDTVKINWVKVWSPPTAGALVRLTWLPNSSMFTRTVTKSDYCNSTAEPAFIHCRPPPDELTADWMSATSTAIDVALFKLDVTAAGSICDINVSYTQFSGVDTGNTASVVTYTSAAAALGGRYFNDLDGSTNNWTAVDLPPNH